jgi:hypothetical protein
MEAFGPIEKATLAHIEQKKFEEGPSGHTIEELLLMKAALVDVLAEEGLVQAEPLVPCAIREGLLRF